MWNYTELRAFLHGSTSKWREDRHMGKEFQIIWRSGISAEHRRLKKPGNVCGGLPTRRYGEMIAAIPSPCVWRWAGRHWCLDFHVSVLLEKPSTMGTWHRYSRMQLNLRFARGWHRLMRIEQQNEANEEVPSSAGAKAVEGHHTPRRRRVNRQRRKRETSGLRRQSGAATALLQRRASGLP